CARARAYYGSFYFDYW
nr:immunoglobulin heavy chain junction region [Mus musculus]